MQLGTNELRRLASDVDDLHRESMRTFTDEMAEVHLGPTATVLGRSRRQFLRRAGAGGTFVALGPMVLPLGRWLPAALAQEDGEGDPDIAAFAESVELAAVAAYSAAVGTGQFEPAVVEVANLFAGHHREHAGAFASLAGAAATGEANEALLDDFAPQIADASDQAALLEVAFNLEQSAVATYLFALGVLQDPAAAAATATVLPIESQHAVVLGQALGKDMEEYVPSFETQEAALDPADYPLS